MAGRNCFICSSILASFESTKSQPQPTSADDDNGSTKDASLQYQKPYAGIITQLFQLKGHESLNCNNSKKNTDTSLAGVKSKLELVLYCDECTSKLGKIQSLLVMLDNLEKQIETCKINLISKIRTIYKENQHGPKNKLNTNADTSWRDENQLVREEFLQVYDQLETKSSFSEIIGTRGRTSKVNNPKSVVRRQQIPKNGLKSPRKAHERMVVKKECPPVSLVPMDSVYDESNSADNCLDHHYSEPDEDIGLGVKPVPQRSNREEDCASESQHVTYSRITCEESALPNRESSTNTAKKKSCRAKSKMIAALIQGGTGEFFCHNSNCGIIGFPDESSLALHVKESHFAVPVPAHPEFGDFGPQETGGDGKQTPFVCDKCGRDLNSQGSFDEHRKKYHGLEYRHWPCSYTDCDLVFNTRIRLQRHLKKVHLDPMKCQQCNKEFKHRSNFRKHMNSHLNIKAFMCEICSRAFTTANSLRNHCGRQHPEHFDLPTFECSECKGVFTSKQSLLNHQQLVHAGKAKYECDICKKKVNSKLHLDRHYVVHTKEKNYQCNICNARFAYKHYLKIHNYKHSGVKPFSCQVCGKQFTGKNRLKYHEAAIHKIGQPIRYKQKKKSKQNS